MESLRFERLLFRGRLGVCRSLGLLLAGTVLAGWARADVRLAGVFGDCMVLQRDVEVPVRGWARPGETVTVQFAGQTIRATAGSNGAWIARLAPMKATATGQDLVVSGSQTVRLSDVLVGDVWLCSGQSNMGTGFDRRPPPLDPGPMNLPQIRYGAVSNFADIAPRADGVVFWVVSGPNTVPRYSAFPWFFGQRLHQEATVPIGILRASWGGATIENWISPDKLRALIGGWRKAWNQPELPFYFVQLPNLGGACGLPEQPLKGWPLLREAQARALAIPHTGMAVTIDCGEEDLHPRNKFDMGRRLAAVAMAKTYGLNVEHTGPIFKGADFKDGKVTLHFDHIGAGLMVGKKVGTEPAAEVPHGQLQEFAIAGPDKRFYAADAAIVGDTVVVSSDKVPSNLIHTPLQVAPELAAEFDALGLGDSTRKIYGMIRNVDNNFGRVRAVLAELGLEDNTLLIFTSDNGPCSGSQPVDRHMAGLHGLKGTVYENGIRVPCFMRWPAGFQSPAKVTRLAAHLDMLPTVLKACGVAERGIGFQPRRDSRPAV